MAKRDMTEEQLSSFDLRQMTQARVRLGRFGAGQPTRAAQSFLLDHAKARQAVWSDVDRRQLSATLTGDGFRVVEVDSRAEDRSTYVRRPDLGRLLSVEGQAALEKVAGGHDVAIVVADGLSASAVELNAVPMVQAIAARLAAAGLSLAPVVLAAQARVALGDPVGETLGVHATIVLIGERPGLSAADSLGAYVTYAPISGTPDSRRNCISNIRDGGLPVGAAADLTVALLRDMFATGVSGVALKQAVAALTADDNHRLA